MKQQALLTGSRYELLVKIATGGTATVYVGRLSGSIGFQRLVAIKRAHPHLRDDPKSRKMLVREATLASRIHHANVVPIQDVEESDDELLLVMDYVEGASLAELLERAIACGEALPTAVTTRILFDAMAGLEAVHALADDGGRPQGMVHRDVSPQNSLVGVDGTARLTDFGLAKLTEVSMSSTAGMQGKIAYMAPEYVEGAPYTQCCDIFSMAVVVWEALASQRLFRGNNEADTLRRVVTLTAPALSSVADLPVTLDLVLGKALSKAPDARHLSMHAFATELFAGSAGIVAADHAEVGEVVRDLMGAELAQRRNVIRAIADPEQATTASMLFDDLPLARAVTEAAVPGSVEPVEEVEALEDRDAVTHQKLAAYAETLESNAARVPSTTARPWLALAVAGGIGAGVVTYLSSEEPQTLRPGLPAIEVHIPEPTASAPSAEVEASDDGPAPETSGATPTPSLQPRPTPLRPPVIPGNPYKDRLGGR
jgi:tRNA A-37 threonylcarbamoyl transferase component Bud32